MTVKWLTASRKAHLMRLFCDYAQTITGFQVNFETAKISNPLYDKHTAIIIADWKADDREAKQYAWLLERKAIHTLGEPRSSHIRGHFNSISSEIWHSSQPQYYVEKLGYSLLTFTPYADVRLSGTFIHLYVNLGDSLHYVSKNARRKAIRYGKRSQSITDIIDAKVSQAVLHYLNN